MKAAPAGKLVQKSAQPLSKARAPQVKSPVPKTGLKMIQLKKKPALKPVKVVAKVQKPAASKKVVGLA